MKKSTFFYKKDKMTNLLFEQNLFADEEGDEGEEEAGEEEGEAEEDEGETPEADDEAEAEDEAEDEEEVPEEAKMKLGKVIDDDLEAILVDFETEARQSKKIENEAQIEESYSLSRALFESSYEEDIDLERFSSEVARLVKNYDTLLDMEDMILSKAKSFIIARYGEKAATEMLNSLADNHDVEIEPSKPAPDSIQDVPVAVGAGAKGE